MPEAARRKTWLVTGASQGLGLAITLSALKAGQKVIAGARNPDVAASAHPEVVAAGGKWLRLDVSLPEARDIVQKSAEMDGIDVVVNNAGYYLVGQIEDLSEEEMKWSMETNFWGPVRVVQGSLPTLRAQKSGTIASISSTFGFVPCPGGALYSAPKAAQDSLQAVLKSELAELNIRPITITAGLYRTGVLINSKQPSKGFSDDSMGGVLGKVLQQSGGNVENPNNIPGDPEKFGDRIVEIVDCTGFGAGLEKTTQFLMAETQSSCLS